MHVRLLLLCCLFSLGCFGQARQLSRKQLTELQAAEQQLAALAVQLHTDSTADNRFQACKQLIAAFVASLKTPNSFHYDFPELEGIAIRYAPDRSFRTITWELFVDRETYRHYGAIQFNHKALKLTPLLDRSDDWRSNPENVIAGADNWLGYVIYNILPGGTYANKPYYFVLGYDRHSAFVRRKVLDVITFDDYGGVQFGLPVFTTFSPEGLLLPERSRIVLDYSAEAQVVLRKDMETGHIIYENLIIMPGNEVSGPLQMPDGSYHALAYREDGKWHEVEKVFTHTYEQPPTGQSPRDSSRNSFFQLQPAGRQE